MASYGVELQVVPVVVAFRNPWVGRHKVRVVQYCASWEVAVGIFLLVLQWEQTCWVEVDPT